MDTEVRVGVVEQLQQVGHRGCADLEQRRTGDRSRHPLRDGGVDEGLDRGGGAQPSEAPRRCGPHVHAAVVQRAQQVRDRPLRGHVPQLERGLHPAPHPAAPQLVPQLVHRTGRLEVRADPCRRRHRAGFASSARAARRTPGPRCRSARAARRPGCPPARSPQAAGGRPSRADAGPVRAAGAVHDQDQHQHHTRQGQDEDAGGQGHGAPTGGRGWPAPASAAPAG